MVFVTYGQRGWGYKDMNIVGISLEHFSQNKEEAIGLTYGNCTMDPKDKAFTQFTQEQMEKKMESYCILLPFPNNTGNGTDSQDADEIKKCAIVFGDRDVSIPWGER